MSVLREISLAIGICLSSIFCVAQQKADDLPENYKTVLTSDFAKVIRVHYGPYEKVPVHNHPEMPTVYVYLNDSGPVQITHYDEKATSIVRPPTHKGAYRVSAGKMERHSVENLSALPSDFLRVELPGFRVEDPKLEFRGKAPEDLSHDISAVEFTMPGLTITRAVCVDATPCEVQRPGTHAIVVAFSDVVLSEKSGAGEKRTALKSGDVMAVQAAGELFLSAGGRDGAHILVISVEDEPHQR
jgi:hypothetical protein